MLSDEMISFLDDFESSLECPICLEFFSSVIYQCDSGHSLCETCCLRVTSCPLCKSQVGKRLRNLLLEEQLTKVTSKCRFESCNYLMKLCEKTQHEQICLYNPQCHCLLQNCKWSGHKGKFLEHLSEKHKVPHYEIHGNAAEYSSRLRSTNLQAGAGCVKLLHTFVRNDVPSVTILTYIFLDSCKNLFYPQFRTLGEGDARYNLRIWNIESEDSDEIVIEGTAFNQKIGLDEERDKKMGLAFDLESLILKFSFLDKQEKGHKLLHYRLTIL
jgi:Seven in absentia protein family